MPLALGLIWAAIFAWLFMREKGEGSRRWLFVGIALIGLAVGAWFTFASDG